MLVADKISSESSDDNSNFASISRRLSLIGSFSSSNLLSWSAGRTRNVFSDLIMAGSISVLDLLGNDIDWNGKW